MDITMNKPNLYLHIGSAKTGTTALQSSLVNNENYLRSQYARTEGADVVIECVGKTIATKQAFDIAKRGATVLLFSVPPVDATFELPLFDVFKKELKIRGSFVNPDTHLRAVNLINAKKINVKPIITHRFPLDQLEQAVQTQMGNESIKVLVKPND